MSRHEVAAKDPRHKVIVGWDHPMLTFFAQVIDRAKEEAGKDEKFVLWIGASYREIYEIDELAARLHRYAALPAELRAALYGDKDDGR